MNKKNKIVENFWIHKPQPGVEYTPFFLIFVVQFWPFWLCLQNHRLFWHLLTGFSKHLMRSKIEPNQRRETARDLIAF